MALVASLKDADSVKVLLQLIAYDSQYPDFPKDAFFLNHPDNYVPPDKGLAPKATFFVLTLLSTLFVLARLCTRGSYLKVGLWWDDYLMVAAIVSTWIWTVMQLLVFYIGGVGRHVYDNPFQALERGQSLEIWNQISYMVTVLLIKFSMLFFFVRITPPNEKRSFAIKIYIGTMAFLVVNFIVQLVMTMLACKPAAAAWDLRLRIGDSHCINWYKMLLGFMSIWAITDVWILVLPIPLIWRLRTTANSKLATLFLFSVGGIACLAAFLKIPFLGGVYNTWDPTWNGVAVLVLHQVEVCFGIIAACMPSLSVWISLDPDDARISRRWRRRRRGAPRSTSYKRSKPKSKSTSGAESRSTGREKGFTSHPKEDIVNQLHPAAKFGRTNTDIRALNELPKVDSELRLHYPVRMEDGKRVDPPPAFWNVVPGERANRKDNPRRDRHDDKQQYQNKASEHRRNQQSDEYASHQRSLSQPAGAKEPAFDEYDFYPSDDGASAGLPKQRFHSLDSQRKKQSIDQEDVHGGKRSRYDPQADTTSDDADDDARSMELVIQRPKSTLLKGGMAGFDHSSSQQQLE